MPETPGYRVYQSDEAKAKVYNHRLFTADKDFERWEPKAQDWWSRYENLAKQNQMTPKGHRVNVGTGVATIDSLFSAMTAVEVDTLVKNLGRGTPAQAMLATAALTKEWDLCDVNEEAAFAIKDALVASIGWVKVAYEYATVLRTVPRARDEVLREVQSLIEEAVAAGQGAPDPDTIADLVPLTVDEEFVLRDRIVVDYVPWDQVRWDPSAKRVKDIRWVAQYTKLPVEDVRQNPAFRDYCRRNRTLKKLDDLKGDSTIEKELLQNNGKPDDDDMLVTVVEFTDLDTGTVCTFVKDQKWLLNETVNPFAANLDRVNRNPFVPLVLRKTSRHVRGIGDMELITPSLDELNVYRTKLANYVERFVPKIAGPEDALTQEAKDALSGPEYGAYVSVSREHDPKSITPLEPPVMPSEVFGIPDKLLDDIRELVGVNELMRGLFPDRKRTATETSEVVAASAARQAEKRNVLEAFFIAIARRILQLMQQFYTQERMLRYVDPMFGQVEWAWTADDIVFEYDFEVHLTPKEAETRQQQRDDAIAEMNFLGPYAQPGPDGSSVVKLPALVARFARKFGWSNQEILEVLNLPEEQQMQKMERLQDVSAQQKAAQGFPDPGLVAGPLGPGELAAATNQGAVPDEVAAAAIGGIGPLTPDLVEQTSESAGVRTPAG